MYELLSHTADIGIAADGDDAGDAFAWAARGLTAVVAGKDLHGRADEEMVFRVEAPDAEALLVAFLSELLWLYEKDGLLWTGGGVTVTDGMAEARGNGILHDPNTDGHGVEVKAVTYHEVRSGWHQDRYHVRVLLDI